MHLDCRQPPGHWPDATSPYEADALAFCRAWAGGQTAFVLHTSGSTGEPKPLTLTRAQMQASAHLTGATFGLRPGDRALVCLNIRYVAGTMMLVRGLELGLMLDIVEPSADPFATLPSVAGMPDHRPQNATFAFAAFVPLQLQTILENRMSRARLVGMKAVLVGGAATSPALEKLTQDVAVPIFSTYGMTETVSHVAIRRLNGPERSDWFQALPGVTLAQDERGCLRITAAATNHQPVQTNDVVELTEGGRFRLLGRADAIINSGGVKIQPEVVERVIQDAFATFGVVRRLFIAGLPDARLGQRVVLFVEGVREKGKEDWSDIQNVMRAQIGPYAVPKEMHYVAHFAETPTGKIDRRATVAAWENAT